MKSIIGTLAILIAAATQLTSGKKCDGPADVIFLLDGSGRLNDTEFYHLRYFVGQLLQFFNVSLPAVRVGVVLYGAGAEVVVPLWPTYNEYQIKHLLSDLRQLNDGHNLAEALRVMRAQFNSAESPRPSATRMGVVFLAGRTTNTGEVVAEVTAALNDGITMFAVGKKVGPEFPEITGNDFCKLFSMGNFNDMHSLVPYLAGAICAQVLPDSELTSSKHDCYPYVPNYSAPPITCPSLNGTYADPTDCTKFYICNFWEPTPVSCPDGKAFNPVLNICDHRETVGC